MARDLADATKWTYGDAWERTRLAANTLLDVPAAMLGSDEMLRRLRALREQISGMILIGEHYKAAAGQDEEGLHASR